MSKKVFIVFTTLIMLVFTSKVYAADIIRLAGDNLTFSTVIQAIADKDDSSTLWKFKIPGTSRKFALIFEVKIVYGFDTSKAEVQTLPESKQLRVRLPRGKILDVQYDTQNMKVYDQQKGLFAAHFTLDEQMKVFNQALGNIRERAEKELKLTEQAENNAQIFINMLAKSFGYEAEVIFSDEPLKKATTNTDTDTDTEGELKHVAESESNASGSKPE